MADHDAQMLKGVLSLILLSLLRDDQDYGYAIVVRLREAGFADLAEGTVYPALSRLEAAGLLEASLVRSSTGPARKYYRATPQGRREGERATRAWNALVAGVATITSQQNPPSTPLGSTS